MSVPLRIGVSACLLGESVRYDGGHARARFVTDVLSKIAELVPVCPEVEMGLGTPRPTMRLLQLGEERRLVSPKTGEDHTAAMDAWAEARVDALSRLGLSGFVLKKGSPSCGLLRVKVYREHGVPPLLDGRGRFAAVLAEAMPELPLEEDGRLNDPGLRERFLLRVFAQHRLLETLAEGAGRAALMGFHAREKSLLMACDPAGQKRLGQLLARRPDAAEYARGFALALSKGATRARHVNVLQHLAGHLRRHVDRSDRGELHGAIDAYRDGEVPRVVPLTLLAHHVRRGPHPWVAAQSYFAPYPRALGSGRV